MANNRIIRVAAMSDSPKLHSGFGVVAAELYRGFHEAGMELHALGFMDMEHDYNHQLPYMFYPTTIFDDLAHQTYSFFLQRIKPDVIFILTDPGNLCMYAEGVVHKQKATYIRHGREFTPPIVAYTPIEGKPIMELDRRGFDCVMQTGGKIAVYNETALRTVERQFPDVAKHMAIVNHGLDHSNFRRYSDEERRELRKLVGLDDYFVIGSVGVNKRTKGFAEMIYAARYLREIGQDKGIKFYCHTNPNEERMYGYKLTEMASENWDMQHPGGVADMFLWKQVRHQENYYLGVSRDNGTIEQLGQIAGQIPDSPEKRGLLFAHYDYISIMNCLDLYVDLSQIEGWGLPVGEAMACGVPTIMVNDHSVREEIYQGGVHMIEPIPERLWPTWHRGARLVTADPHEVGRAILKLKADPILRQALSDAGQKVAQKYSWAKSREQMISLVTEAAEMVFNEDEAYKEERGG